MTVMLTFKIMLPQSDLNVRIVAAMGGNIVNGDLRSTYVVDFNSTSEGAPLIFVESQQRSHRRDLSIYFIRADRQLGQGAGFVVRSTHVYYSNFKHNRGFTEMYIFFF